MKVKTNGLDLSLRNNATTMMSSALCNLDPCPTKILQINRQLGIILLRS